VYGADVDDVHHVAPRLVGALQKDAVVMNPWGRSRHRDGHGFCPFFGLFLPLFAASLLLFGSGGSP
jgi:hypothetical protein